MRILSATAALAAASLAAGPTLAQSLVGPGYYVGVQGSFVLPSDQDFETSLGKISTDVDEGFGVGVSGGVILDGGFRGELELNYRENEVGSHRLNGGSALAGSKGTATSTSLMANAFYDIPAFAGTTYDWITPYVGAGVGYTWVEFEDYTVDALAPGNALDDTTSGFGAQIILGMSWRLQQNLDLTADYRYFTAPELDVRAAGRDNSSIDYNLNSINVGLRSRF
ncbi:MAG: outer membrane beta-barrel protein [Pseudomonadota bacterium]